MSLWERYEIIRMSSFHLVMPSELQLHNTLNRGSVLVGRLTVGTGIVVIHGIQHSVVLNVWSF